MSYKKTLFSMAVAALLLAGGTALSAQQSLIEWVNYYRSLAGVDLVELTTQARVVAYEHNLLVLSAGASGHYYGFSELQRKLDRARVDYRYLGEVVCFFAYHEIRPKLLVEVFQSSDPHWQILMHPRYTHMSYHVAHSDGNSSITIFMIQR